MCNCVNETTKTMQKDYVAQVESQVKVYEWIDKGSYQHRGFSLKGESTRIGMPFVLEFRQLKKDGTPQAKVTNEHVMIYPTYCPFCGEKISDK